MTFVEAADAIRRIDQLKDANWLVIEEYNDVFVFTQRFDSGSAACVVVEKGTGKVYPEVPELIDYGGYGKRIRYVKEEEIEALGLRAERWGDSK